MATKLDANGNTESYTYDANQRLTAIPERQQTFTYDTCPANASGCVNAPGRLVQATFGSGIGVNALNFAYNYAYTPAGKVSARDAPGAVRQSPLHVAGASLRSAHCQLHL